MSKLSLLANVLCSVLIVACGGGSDTEPGLTESGSMVPDTELTVARFSAVGPVQGLAYSTQSQSGFTDEQANFFIALESLSPLRWVTSSCLP